MKTLQKALRKPLARRKTNGNSGFSLPEMLVSITIIGILAGVGTLAAVSFGNRSNEEGCLAERVGLQLWIDTYMAENGKTRLDGGETDRHDELINAGFPEPDTLGDRWRVLNAQGWLTPVLEGDCTFSAPPSQTGLTDIIAHDRALDIWWSPPENDGGSTIYNYEFTLDGGTVWQEFSPTNITGYHRFTGLENGREYEVMVRALNEVEKGPASDMLSATPYTVPSRMSEPTVSNPTENSLDVAWEAPNYDGGRDLVRYQIYVDGEINKEVPASATSTTVTGLTHGTYYTVAVSACNNMSGWDPRYPATHTLPSCSQVSPYSPPNVTKPQAPTNITLQNVTTTTTTFGATWNPSTSEIVDGYNVYYKTEGAEFIPGTDSNELDEGISSPVQVPHTSATTYTQSFDNDPDIPRGDYAAIYVTAYNEAGESDLMRVDSKWNAAVTEAPRNLDCTVPQLPRRIDCSWQEPNNTHDNAKENITGYILEYRTAASAPNGAWTTHGTTDVSTSRQIAELVNGTSYQIRVRAVNDMGLSPENPTLPTQMVRTTHNVPAQPNVSCNPTANTARSITCNWSHPNNGGFTARGNYTLQRRTGTSGSFSNVSTAISGNSTSFVNNTGLSNGTLYQYRLIASNAAGSSTASSANSATTPSLPPAPSVSATGGIERMSVSWTAGNGGCPIIEFQASHSGTSTNTSKNASSSSHTFTGMSAGTYAGQVRARNCVGWGSWGQSSNVSVIPNIPPTAAPAAKNACTSSLGNNLGNRGCNHIDWPNNSQATHYSILRYSPTYSIRPLYITLATIPRSEMEVVGGRVQYFDAQLRYGASYNYSIRGHYANGTSDSSWISGGSYGTLPSGSRTLANPCLASSPWSRSTSQPSDLSTRDYRVSPSLVKPTSSAGHDDWSCYFLNDHFPINQPAPGRVFHRGTGDPLDTSGSVLSQSKSLSAIIAPAVNRNAHVVTQNPSQSSLRGRNIVGIGDWAGLANAFLIKQRFYPAGQQPTFWGFDDLVRIDMCGFFYNTGTTERCAWALVGEGNWGSGRQHSNELTSFGPYFVYGGFSANPHPTNGGTLGGTVIVNAPPNRTTGAKVGKKIDMYPLSDGSNMIVDSVFTNGCGSMVDGRCYTLGVGGGPTTARFSTWHNPTMFWGSIHNASVLNGL